MRREFSRRISVCRTTVWDLNILFGMSKFHIVVVEGIEREAKRCRLGLEKGD